MSWPSGSMEQIDRSGVRDLAWVVAGERPVPTRQVGTLSPGIRITHRSASGPCATSFSPPGFQGGYEQLGVVRAKHFPPWQVLPAVICQRPI